MALEMRDELLAGRYRKLETIGVGGMAKVYLAEDERLGRRVAVKRLHSDSPEDAAERFEREAKLGASLNHPNLVSIFDIATDGESVLIVMEYVEGETLKHAIAAGPMPVDEVMKAMGDVAAALDHAHAHGVVHRDVKPANILLRRDGMAKLADLGIATAAEGTRITRSGMVLGTAAYMAPEQLDGRAAGPAADIYSLATVTFEALTGEKARTGNTPMEVAHRVTNDPPPDLRESWAGAPDDAAEVLRRAMSQHPEDRPTSAAELVVELRRELEWDARPAAPSAAAAVEVPAEEPPPADTALRERLPDTAPREHSRRADEPPSRAPALRSSRKLPSWVPAAALLVAFCLIGAIVLAASGGDGGGEKADRADRGNLPAKRAPAKKPESRTNARAGEGGRGSAAAPASGSGQPGSGTGASQPQGGSADAAALQDEGHDLMLAERYDEAIPLLQQAVNSANPKDVVYAWALYDLGRSLRLGGRPKEAIPVLERRLEIPNQPETVRRELDAARRDAARQSDG